MTFPNRRDYTPGEKKRARKCVAVATGNQKSLARAVYSSAGARRPTAWSPPATTRSPSVATRTRASGKQRAARAAAATAADGSDTKRAALESPLHVEVMAELAAFAPVPDPQLLGKFDSADARSHHSQQHVAPVSLAPLLASTQQLKQKTERARQCLLADELFQQQQQTSNNRLLSLAHTGAGSHDSSVAAEDGADALQAVLQQLPAPPASAQLGRDMMEQVTADLQNIAATSLHELAHPLAMLSEQTVRSAYDHALRATQELSVRQLQLGLADATALRLSDGAPSSSPSPPSPPPMPMAMASLARLASEQHAKKRTNLPKTAKSVLKTWFDNHLHHPYPSEEEKASLALAGGITMDQVNNWFINTRGRKWKPLLTRLVAEKEAGDCTLYDQMVERIEEPYRRAPTKR